MAVGKGYEPLFDGRASTTDGYGCPQVSFDASASKLIKTQGKGTLMLVPCSAEEDEQIMLVTLRGGFRGGYARIEGVGVEVLFQNTSDGHCLVTGHLIVRLTHPQGYVYAETGRRCSTGLVEIFSWAGYQTMPTEEFEIWRTSQVFGEVDSQQYEQERVAALERARAQKVEADTAAQAKAVAAAAKVANASHMRPVLEPRLTALSERRKAIGLTAIILEAEGFRLSESWGIREYVVAEVDKTEAEVVAAEAKFAEAKMFEAGVEGLWQRMTAVGITFETSGDNFVAREGAGYNQYFQRTTKGLDKLREFVEQVEAKVVEAKAQADAVAEKSRREAEAAVLGLPSNVEIWKRRGGATSAGDGWVIKPDGMSRERDEMRCPRPRHSEEGTQVWRQILPGELVLSWAKSCTAAAHEFVVVHRPEMITKAQLRLVALLQEELEAAYEGARGMASGLPSPPVGEGWGLLPEPRPEPTAKPVAEGGGAVSQDALAALKARFAKK